MEGTIRLIADALLNDVAVQKRAEVRQVHRIAELVDASATVGPVQLAGGERLVGSGADGTPKFAEFLILELAGILGVGQASAWALIRDVLNLRHRHPRLWTAMDRGEVPIWQARKIAARCADAGLDLAAALVVDRRLESAWGRLSWTRVLRRTEGLIVSADTALAAEKASVRKADRFVAVYHDGDGSSTLLARMNTADAVHLKDAIDTIANAMVIEGRSESLPQLRSEALADLARPTEHSTLPRPEATLVVHVAQEAVEGDTDTRVARADTIGPLLLEQVRELLAHHRVRLLPVLDLAGDPGVDAYEIPDRMRTQLHIREPFSVFPFSTTRSVHADLDHTIPYRVNGPHGQTGPPQTRPSNLGPLGRREHRAKTFGGWQLSQPEPGTYRWKSPFGYEYEVSNGHTERISRQAVRGPEKPGARDPESGHAVFHLVVPERDSDFSAAPAGAILIDPLPPDPDEIELLEPPGWVEAA